jgi:hypothetical protein
MLRYDNTRCSWLPDANTRVTGDQGLTGEIERNQSGIRAPSQVQFQDQEERFSNLSI